MKATYAVVKGEEKLIFKDPKTDDGTKRSQRGRVVVLQDGENTVFKDGLTIEQEQAYEDENLLEDIFYNGELVREQSLADIRKRLAEQV
jgi:nicotinamide phosphoribosyltransferase